MINTRNNNRKTGRFKVRFPATILTGAGALGRQSVHTKNISSSGVFLQTVMPMKEGTCINLEIILENKRLKKITGFDSRLYIDGVIVRQEADGVAVKFNDHKVMSTPGLSLEGRAKKSCIFP
jgi:hypothetical protein